MKTKQVYTRRFFTALTVAFCIVALIICGCGQKPQDDAVSSNIAEPVIGEDTLQPSEPYKVSSATIVSIGDIMIHEPQLTGAKVPGKEEWDFSAFFKELSPYFAKADFSIANLETTFAGNAGRKYGGYPCFNTPDSLADAIKASGLSMVQTANNHSYDTGAKGFERTQQVLLEKGVPYIGTRLSEDAPKYAVQELNGIRVGFVSYTYESGRRNGLKTLNGITVKEQHTNLINSFSYSEVDEFYSEVDSIMAEMKADGVEATIFYMHWGNEYKTTENSRQNALAQGLCDRGVDVIVGGHPHVIQPMEMLTSEDGEHKTVCIYSLGNAVSDQRVERMDSCPSGHTEDGVLFYCTFDKYSDGRVVLSDIDIIPTWVDKYLGVNGYQYTIYPLVSIEQDIEKYGFIGTAATKCRKSYERTLEILAEGLTDCQKAIGCYSTFPENK